MLLGFAKENAPEEIILGEEKIVVCSSVKLLGVIFDNKLSFREYVEKLCIKATQRSKALARIRPFLTLSSAKLLSTAYILSSFKYCPIIWMYHDLTSKRLINKVHKRVLSIVYDQCETSFETLLELDCSSTIHIDNLRSLMTEVYKSLNKLNPEFMWDAFPKKQITYDLRSGNTLLLSKKNTVTYGVNSLQFRACSLWNKLPKFIKDSNRLSEFKNKIKKWKGDSCNCKLCI